MKKLLLFIFINIQFIYSLEFIEKSCKLHPLATYSIIPIFIFPINAYFGNKAKKNKINCVVLYFSGLLIIINEFYNNKEIDKENFILMNFYSLLSFLAGYKIK